MGPLIFAGLYIFFFFQTKVFENKSTLQAFNCLKQEQLSLKKKKKKKKEENLKSLTGFSESFYNIKNLKSK